MIPLILAIIVPQCLALPSQSNCQDVKEVEKFNISAFGSGIWHEIARYPNAFELLDRCISFEHTYNGDSVNMKLRNVAFNSIYSIDGTTEYADAKKSGNLSISLKYGWPVKNVVLPLKALAIDYERYAIYYACIIEKNTGLQQEYAWIYSRTVSLEGSAKKEVDEFLKSSGAIDAKKLIWIDNTSEACKFSSTVGNLPKKMFSVFNV